MSIPKKPRTCRVCKAVFQPSRIMQQVCGPECAIEQAKAKRSKAERVAQIADRKTIKLKLDKLKTARDWRKKAQTVFNRWIRLVKCAGMPCISCGKYHSGQNHAGHFQNSGDHPELSFEPDNVWLQCQPCNTSKHGNLLEYQKNLVLLIGKDRVDWLLGPHELPHRRKDDYQEIEMHYKKLLKEAGHG